MIKKSVYKEALEDLKDFQRKTVNHVFKRFYGRSSTRRFLVADEVGLGKTMVARGVIAKSIEHLLGEGKIKRIDVVYICSNISIASQNIGKLRIGGVTDAEHNGSRNIAATRLTYLPVQAKQLQLNPINFISLTARTTFDHSSRRGGTADERAIIYHMLYDLPWARGKLRQTYRRGLINLLQGTAGKESWTSTRSSYHLSTSHYQVFRKDTRSQKAACTRCIDAEIGRDLRKLVLADYELYEDLKECAFRFKRIRKYIPAEDNELRWKVVGKLRKILAHACVSALEPDLVIMDEFQRFQDLMDGESESARLAEAVFNYGDAKVLLLSATPYKMLTLPTENTDQNHYSEFLNTLKFLYNHNNRDVNKAEQLIAGWRTTILEKQFESEESRKLKNTLQNQLLKVMCRTERVRFTKEFNAMVTEDRFDDSIDIVPDDLRHARFMDKVSLILDAGDMREYWKSSPYLLNYLKGYVIRKKFDQVIADPDVSDPLTHSSLLEPLKSHPNHLIRSAFIENYKPMGMHNSRMRTLLRETVERGMWKLLWIPPSMPYTKPSGVYSKSEGLSKSVIFSSWNAVPDAISTLCSYEAERRMVKGTLREEGYHREMTQPLTYDKRQDKRSILSWVLPFPSLAAKIDPLNIAMNTGLGSQTSVRTLLAGSNKIVKKLLEPLKPSRPPSRRDARWYWMAPLLLETGAQDYNSWLQNLPDYLSAVNQGLAFVDNVRFHLKEAMDLIEDPSELGSFPKDLTEFITQLALGAPGTCVVRAFGRQLDPSTTEERHTIWNKAFQTANAFRTIYNSPEVSSMLGKIVTGRTFLRKTLKYNIDGNFQALLDEYVHHLAETPNNRLKTFEKRLEEISEIIQSVLSIRTAQLSVDEISVNGDQISKNDFQVRTRFALRYGEFKEEEKNAVTRATTVRDAFNSPFRPFVLASTSVGQEGLDFHLWCHSIIHWNLPSNPVDLEQREGRIHRYKSLAIRRNVAEVYGLQELQKWDGKGDPWELIFQAARNDNLDKPELIPFWIFDKGSTKIQRRIPLLPFSREEIKIDQLKRGLSIYRLAFGQPRQSDLLDHVDLGQSESVDYHKHLISLEPPG